MTWHRHFRKKRLLILVVAVALYAGLWFLTHQFGAPQVRAVAVDAMHLLPHYTEATQRTSRFSGRIYWCSTRAYAPLLVHAEYGWQGGPLSGDGRSALYLWFFGHAFRIRELDHWAS